MKVWHLHVQREGFVGENRSICLLVRGCNPHLGIKVVS